MCRFVVLMPALCSLPFTLWTVLVRQRVCVCLHAREGELMRHYCHRDNQPPMAWVAWPQLALGAEAAWH